MDQGTVDYSKISVTGIKGRYITYDHLNAFLSRLPPEFNVEEVGISVEKRPVKSITYGHGPKRILIWSQMHGNETTTTKAVMDLLNFLQKGGMGVSKIMDTCSLKIIPILNPDGAKVYTRVNANKKDLNRDAQDLSQPESRILDRIYNFFQPHYCFNLHDQRTIFNVGKTNKPATVSFLAPAFDADRNDSPSRAKSMRLIAAMNSVLQKVIPGQVGRYDDGFNANCVGDAFQMKNTPTLLFEAGHYAGDYQREKTREFIFYALLKAVRTIANEGIDRYTIEQYLEIPENGKQYVDILVTNPKKINQDFLENKIIYIQYQEVLRQGKVHFLPQLHNFDMIPVEIYGHRTVNCDNNDDVIWLKKAGALKLLI